MRNDLLLSSHREHKSSSHNFLPHISCALNPVLSHLPEPALNFNVFFSDANDYFASYPLKLIACKGALWKASLSCHSLERHVNCTYRLLGGMTHHRWHNLISDTFSPRLERIYSRC